MDLNAGLALHVWISLILGVMSCVMSCVMSYTGEESCMQIYTVPKRTVICEPSQEIRSELDMIKDKISKQSKDTETLKSLLISNNHHGLKDSPQDTNKKSEFYYDIIETQVNHSHRLMSLESALQDLKNKFDLTNDMRSLNMMQSDVLKAASSANILSALEAKVAELTIKLYEMDKKLSQSELELMKKRYDSETRLMNLIDKYHADEVDTSKKVTQVSRNLSIWQQKVTEDGKRISLLENKTESMEKIESYNHIREPYSEINKTDINRLRSILQQVNGDKQRLEEKASKLEKTVSDLENEISRMRKELRACSNSTDLEERSKMDDEKIVVKPQPHILRVPDCQKMMEFFKASSGVYTLSPDGAEKPFEAFCEMTSEGNGWTIIQRRYHGNVDFYRGWKEYCEGFGDRNGEYWLGLENIYALTKSGHYVLQVDLQDFDNKWYFASYSNFSIEGPNRQYRLHVAGYKGNVGDALSYHNNMTFVTHDLEGKKGECARLAHGAWWYNDCHLANLNGQYYETGKYWTSDGIVWKEKNDSNFKPFKSTIMKIKSYN